jgi:hypothetical protein
MSVTACGFAFPVQAQELRMDVVSDPICFKIRNTADYRVYGSFITDYYPDESGVNARHRSDFRLDAMGARDEDGQPLDVSEFCTYGPFMPGRKLELVLRTLFPIFTCQTRIDQGDILIKSRPKPDGGTKTSAACFE